MIPVIICGGVGSKMWPESQPTSPKHFLPLFNGRSLFELNYELLKKKFDPKQIYISTNQEQSELIKKYAPEIPVENYFLEPEMRNTGPAIGFIAAKLWKDHKDEPFMVVQSDILRQPDDKFLEMIDLFDSMMKKSDKKWITGAIRPPFAMMGVDYMISESGTDLSDWMVSKEKEQVESYINNGKAWLHANHYCWTPEKWLGSYKKFKPEWYEPLMEIAQGGDEKLIYPNIPKGRTEEWTEMSVKAGEGLMVPVPFEWWDFGTWESVSKYLGDENENKVEVEAQNNFVRSDKKVAIIGLSDLVVIDSPNGLLVCPKSMTGKVGEVPKMLENNV